MAELPMSAPAGSSRRYSTFRIPEASPALAVRLTVPFTAAPSRGLAIDTVGGILSPPPVGEVTVAYAEIRSTRPLLSWICSSIQYEPGLLKVQLPFGFCVPVANPLLHRK